MNYCLCTRCYRIGEKIQSNYTRVAVVAWLFVALILTQSYTASLTSMLTISQLQPSVESLKMSNAKVGCDEYFLRTYLQDVLQYKPENVKPMHNENDYLRSFENGSISAAFLEIPYAKVFANKYCRRYTVYGSTYRFGGFGFVFQKGSPIAADISKAILQLAEDGTLQRLEEEWLTPSAECLDSQTNKSIDILSFQSFWGLYLFSIGTSSTCFLLFLVKLLKNYCNNQESGDISRDVLTVFGTRLLDLHDICIVKRLQIQGELQPPVRQHGTPETR